MACAVSGSDVEIQKLHAEPVHSHCSCVIGKHYEVNITVNVGLLDHAGMITTVTRGSERVFDIALS